MKYLLITVIIAVLLLATMLTGCKKDIVDQQKAGTDDTSERTTDNEVEPLPKKDSNDTMDDINEEGIELFAKVLEVNEGSFLVECIMENKYNLTKVSISYDDELIGLSKMKTEVNVGDLMQVIIANEIAESFPPQAKMVKLISVEPDGMIIVDDREMISGIIGEFPSIVATKDSNMVIIGVDIPFVIVLEEDGSTENTWMISEIPEGIKIFKDVYEASENTKTGNGGIHYFGIKAEKAGKYTLEFIYQKTGNDVEEVVQFTVNVDE